MLLCSPHGRHSKKKGKGISARDRARRRRGREFRHENAREVGGVGNLGMSLPAREEG